MLTSALVYAEMKTMVLKLNPFLLSEKSNGTIDIRYEIAEKRQLIYPIAYRIRCHGPAFRSHFTEPSVGTVLPAVSTQICVRQRAALQTPPSSLSFELFSISEGYSLA